MRRPVVVGVDGSPASLVAAEHAARAAVRRSAPLHLVHGYLHALGYGVPLNPYDMGIPAPSESAEKMLAATVADLAGRWPGLEIEARQVAGGPGATLVEESRHADLVVVGSRGLGGFTGLLLGSVGTQVAGHARCPVLVVRPTDEQLPAEGQPPGGGRIHVDGPVLVGVDGSESAELALAYAADEAARRGTTLVLAHVAPPDEGTPDDSAVLLDSAEAAARATHPDLVIGRQVWRADRPEQALVDASGEVALVVVGSRGHGGVAGLLLGSVSQALVQHSRCPVLVAHPYGHEA
ncbi:nucleotide-binding universal stress UspA family protein [Micromonospora endolithica]|nr:nucleotide-binding universal stress UspA family protein [Micromonospora endolithica]